MNPHLTDADILKASRLVSDVEIARRAAWSWVRDWEANERKHGDWVMRSAHRSASACGYWSAGCANTDPECRAAFVSEWDKAVEQLRPDDLPADKHRMEQIAATILQQLGGARFIAMTGARDLVYGARSLHMRVGRNAKGVTKIRITLLPSDEYEAVAFTTKRRDLREVGRAIVQADGLRGWFEEVTSLRTSL